MRSAAILMVTSIAGVVELPEGRSKLRLGESLDRGVWVRVPG